MIRIIAIITAALLTACAAGEKRPTITSPEGGVWTQSTDGTWRDRLGRTTDTDPRIPLCSDVTLKKDTRECVVNR